MQTVSTVGYGSLAPYTTVSQITSWLFATTGFVFLAIWCGLIFAVFAQPQNTILVSKCACVTTRNGERRLEFRVAGAWTKRPIVRASAKCFLFHRIRFDESSKKIKGTLDYQQFPLKLEEDGEHPFVRFPAMFAHVIKPPEECHPDEICMYNLTVKDWKEHRMGCNVVVTGWDTCLQREVFAYWTFNADDIKFGRHFVPCFSTDEVTREVSIDMRNFNATSKDSDFNEKFQMKRVLGTFRKLMQSRIAMKKWLNPFFSDHSRVINIVDAAMDRGLDSVEALAEAGQEMLSEMGITKELHAVMNALLSHRNKSHSDLDADDLDPITVEN